MSTFQLSEQRESGIETLRILSMFLVLIIHANFLSNEAPTTSLTISNPITAYTQYFFASVSYTCVNTFVLISGWFGITPKWKGFFSLFFQCFFWGALCYGITILLKPIKR